MFEEDLDSIKIFSATYVVQTIQYYFLCKSQYNTFPKLWRGKDKT